MGETLLKICRDEEMPGRSTVWQWKEAHPQFATMYARAQQFRAELWADEVIDISDDARNDMRDQYTPNGTVRVVDHENIQRSKLRVDTRKWVVSKLLPKFKDRPEEPPAADQALLTTAQRLCALVREIDGMTDGTADATLDAPQAASDPAPVLDEPA